MREASKEELLERIESLEKECELWMRGFGKEQNKVEDLQGEVERIQKRIHQWAFDLEYGDAHRVMHEMSEEAERQEGEG